MNGDPPVGSQDHIWGRSICSRVSQLHASYELKMMVIHCTVSGLTLE